MFTNKIPICTLSILGILSFPATAKREFHVAPPPSGDNANPGTLAQPFATIAHAELQTKSGDVVYLHKGVYRESVRFRSRAIASAPITYKPYDDGSGPHPVTISGFDPIEPGVNGTGQWERHSGAIYKIQLTPEHGLTPGESAILIDGAIQKIARWPNAPSAYDFDWERMASPESATHDTTSGAPKPPYEGAFFTASYNDVDLPGSEPNAWVGARIDTSPGGGVFRDSGFVTASDSGSVTFRYRPFPYPSQFASKADPYFLWNHLNALDEEGEYFFDIEGVNGPPHTLYLWAPGGNSPAEHRIEIKNREYSFDLNWASHIHIRGLTFLGAGIVCPVSSSLIVMDDLTLRYCGSGLNTLKTGRAAIWLKGHGHKVLNSRIDSTYGGGVLTLGTHTEIAHNVIRDCMLYAISSWKSSDINVHHNTVFGNQAENIHMYSPRGKFNYNHCYHGGKRVTDAASLNSNYDGDLRGMEVAYNWVHSNVARRNPEFTDENGANRLVWGGGRGIRMDTSPSNVFIHHNLIWGMSAPNLSLMLWALDSEQVNYRNSMQRVYNNTVLGQIHIADRGSIGGIDIRNNICTEVREFGAQIDPHIVRSNFLTIGKFESRWPGNTTDSSLFVSAPTGNFALLDSAGAIDAGEIIPGITDGFHGSAPDVGALEYNGDSNPHWSAGAIIRPRDTKKIRFSLLKKPNGERYLVAAGMPEGRILPREFTARLGTVILGDHRLVYSTETHTGEAYFRIEDDDLSGVMPVEFALDGVSYQGNGDTVEFIGSSISIDSIDITSTTPSGGSLHTISGQGFGSTLWTVPLRMENVTGDDLSSAPVPVIFNTREHIVGNRMKHDCADLRVMHWETGRELKHWVESGANSECTLLWVKYGDDSPLPTRFSHVDESGYYLSFGDPDRQSTSDPSIVYDYFPELLDPELQVWIAGNRLAEKLKDRERIATWENSGQGITLTQPNPTRQPVLRLDQVNGLPAADFNGADYLHIHDFPNSVNEGLTVFAVIKSHPSHDPQGRLLSIGDGRRETNNVRQGRSTEWRVYGVKRAYDGNITAIGTGRRFEGASHYMTADVAELMVFSNLQSNSTGVGMDRINKYFNRKYAIGTTPRGVVETASLQAPTQFHLDGRLLGSVTILDEQTATFTAPPLGIPYRFFGFSGLAAVVYDQLILGPMSLPVSVTRGTETRTAGEELLYYIPAYDRWAADNLPPGSRGALQDPDGDHLANLVEFATSSSALASSGGPMSPVFQADSELPYMQFYRNTAATDVFLFVEYSRDLDTWTALPSSDPRISVADPDPFGDGSRLLMQVAPDPETAQMFYRLRAERARP